MLYFLQFKTNGKEPWRPYTAEQLKDPSTLPGPPSFQTVLMVDQNPEELFEKGIEPLETVKYLGPMYFDFDKEDDLDRALDDARLVLDYLMTKLDIPGEFINCWLSGGKGVHFTIAGEVFGVKSATKFLPYIYREIMLTVQDGVGLKPTDSAIDNSVYSCGQGRMWRCEGVARPGKGTYKVGVSIEELQTLDAEGYGVLVAQPRPKMAVNTPPKNVTYPKCVELFKKAKLAASRRVRALLEATTVPRETFREWEGIPGCVQILITEGDCDSSTWNQAALQLSSYIAAAYDRSEEKEYMELLVYPFCKNVESSSRPSETERIKHVKGHLSRTFAGQFKFAPGAFISVIGKRCGGCPVCRADIANGDTDQAGASPSQYNAATNISWDPKGYWLVMENGRRQLSSFTFWPEVEVHDLEPHMDRDGTPGWRISVRKELQGYLIDDEGRIHRDVRIPERAWGSKRELISSIQGHGDALVYAGDADIQRLLKAVTYFGREKAEDKELEKMTRSAVCGLILDRKDGKVIPHYVEADSSITIKNMRSGYRYSGNPRQSPALLRGSNPFENDTDLETALIALCNINDPLSVAMIIGWTVACHFREHIQFREPQFPLLNISGNSEAGKTSTAVLVAMLSGIDYTVAEYMNVEVGTEYPLIKYLSSSTTVPRLVEEVNPGQLGTKYPRIAGILKASWNKAPVQRGRIMGKELGQTDDRISAPIVYTSEQSPVMPALRGRSVEVKLQSRSLDNPVYQRNYSLAIRHKDALLRMAKALVTVAMGTSPSALLEIFHSKHDLIHAKISSRPRWGHMTCLTGLHMLLHTMTEFKVGGREEVQRLYDGLVGYLGGGVVKAERGRMTSEVDRVLTTMNIMAESSTDERYQLKPGMHYWRLGDSLYLVLHTCMPRYKSFSRNQGDTVVIQAYSQLRDLIIGETYYERSEPYPGREDTEVFVLSLSKLAERGTVMNNFMESDVPEEA